MTKDQFIIEMTLVDPISKIVAQLKAGAFRDCDINWLEAKLEKFTRFTCETLGITSPLISREMPSILNDCTVNKYIEYFNTLLEYFKSI